MTEPGRVRAVFLAVFGDHRDERRVWDSIVRRYSEPHRYYHTLAHIDAMCGLLAYSRPLGRDSRTLADDAVPVAVLLHDLFYEPRAIGNEYRSAVNAGNICRHLCRPELVDDVRRLIGVTRDHKPSSMVDEKYIVDLDLSILGAKPDVFDQYERDIRAEYSHVTDEAFRKGRLAWLSGMLAREQLFSLFCGFEADARANLQRSFERLTKGSVP